MSTPVLDLFRALALLALLAAFAYGFLIRVSRMGVLAAVAASIAYVAAEASELLSQYRFPEPGLLAAAGVAGIAVFAVLVYAFYRWPRAVAPTLAVLAAVRIPIPVNRASASGAAAEYLFLLVPLYGAAIAALVAQGLRPDIASEPLWRRDPLRVPLGALIGWAAMASLWTAGPVQGAIRLYSFWLLLPTAYHAIWRSLRVGTAAVRTESDAASPPIAGPGESSAPIESPALPASPAQSAQPAGALPSSWWRTAETLVVLGTVLAILGIYQHFAHWLLLRNTNVESTPWQQVIFRVNAIFWDPNMFARFLIVTGLLAGALWFARRGRVRWLALGLIPMVMALYFTYSRSGWLVAVFAVALVAWIRLGWKRALIVLLILCILLTGTLLVIRSPKFRKTTMQLLEATLGIVTNGRLNLATPINKLTGGRYGLIEGGISMFRARPVAGWGLGSFPTVYPRFRPPGAPPALVESHNSIITIAAEMGLVGLILLAWAIVRVVKLLWHALREFFGADHALVAAIAGALFAIVVHSLLYAALVEDPFTWVMLALVPSAAALGVARSARSGSDRALEAHEGGSAASAQAAGV